MIVTNSNIQVLLKFIDENKYVAIDTETTGLNSWLGDKLFSIIIGNDKKQFYLNFNEKSEPDFYKLKREIIPYLYQSLKHKIIFMHNAKFDMAMLYNEGLDLTDDCFTIHCTEAMARIENNCHINLKLETLAKIIGYEKIDAVKKHMDKHKLYNWVKNPGKKKREKDYFYDLVPIDIIVPYGLRDAEITYALGMYQVEKFNKMDKPDIWPLVENERKLTKALFECEKNGVRLDIDFTKRAYEEESKKFNFFLDSFEKLTGTIDIDGKKTLKLIFDENNIKYNYTKKNNPSFDDECLTSSSSEIAKIILQYRESYKLANTYYLNFLNYSDKNGMIHVNFRQARPTTGRMSITNPALQTVGKVEEDHIDFNKEFLPRKCFIPDEDSFLLDVDYKAQEMRLLFEYAKQQDVIDAIKNGEDVHTTTAKGMGVRRKEAKGLNFGICYGMGKGKLADSLNIDLQKAVFLKNKYFSRFSGIKKLIYKVSKKAESRGFIFNWLGRRSYFPDKNKCYKATNSLIQSSGADIMKVAIVKLHEYLKNHESRMLLSIHDEILFNIKNNEKHIVPDLIKIMINAYPHKLLPMGVDVEFSKKSWQEKEPYII